MRFLAIISYDGSKYYGFQKLNNQKTIQGELENALTKINKNKVSVKGAGRTDRGVHAYHQIIHFELDINISETSLKSAINSIIDKGIYVKSCRKINDEFHARFSAKEKVYEYIINLGEYNPLENDYAYNYNCELDLKAMKKASKYLLGLNSYKAFVTGVNKTYISALYKIKFREEKDLLYIKFIGSNFYNHMVRNLVGALILVGNNKIKAEGIKEMLIEEKRIYEYITVPACGLYLLDIIY